MSKLILDVTADTWGKTRIAQSKDLGDAEKIALMHGSRFELTTWNHASNGHYRVELREPLLPHDRSKSETRWFVFGDHCRILEDGLLAVKHGPVLDVPYYSQRDNREQPNRTCNTSSHAMLLKYLKPKSIFGDDEYFQKYVKGLGDSTDWGVHTNALKVNGVRSEFRTNLTYRDLDNSLARGLPVPIGVLHRGSIANPAGGHVVLVVGSYPEGYVVHDPWGAGFGYQNTNGANCKYPRYPSLDARWIPGEGYGRLITEIDGNKTGL